MKYSAMYEKVEKGERLLDKELEKTEDHFVNLKCVYFNDKNFKSNKFSSNQTSFGGFLCWDALMYCKTNFTG